MQYRNFGKTGKKVSILGFGAMRLPLTNKEDNGSIDRKKSIQMIRYSIDHGVNYIDTAYPYHEGKSELIVSEALKAGYRSRVNLADKLPSWKIHSPEDFDIYFNEQLQKLCDTQINFYLLHSLNQKSWENLYSLGVLDWMQKQKENGKIQFIGFSFHDSFPVFETIINAFEWDFCQIQLNYMDIDYQAGLKGLKLATKKGIGTIVMEPLKGGRLAKPRGVMKDLFQKEGVSRDPVQWALDWVWDMPETSMLLSGMSTLVQVKDNIKFAQLAKPNQFSKDDHLFIDKVQKTYESLINVDCTQCGYCMPCPYGINIPLNFEFYNDSRFVPFSQLKNAYKNFLKEEQRAKNCQKCGSCEEKCPQKITIQEFLTKISSAFR